MKYFRIIFSFYLIFIAFCYNSYSQNQNNEGFVNNVARALNAASSANIQAHGSSTRFYNPKRKLIGSIYLFDDWDNEGVIITKDKNSFLVKNINLNIKYNSFISKISKDSIFTFNMNNIDKIIIKNRIYKNVFSEEGKKICQVVFESDMFSILKAFSLQEVEGSPNPMANRKTDKIIRKESYYLLKNSSFTKTKLNRRKILKLIDVSKTENVKKFVKQNNLSYKNDNDVRKILIYSSSLN